jgi:hypothetical protein
MKTNQRLNAFLVILGLALFACGQFQIGIEQPAQTSTPEPVNGVSPNMDSQAGEQPGTVRDNQTNPDYSQYWTPVEDFRTGLKFALPCFWTANIPVPDQGPTNLGSFSVNNFTEAFVTSLGPKQAETVWEIGGLKFDLGYHRFSDFGLDVSASLDDLAYALVNPGDDHGIESLLPVEVDGKTGVQVNAWSNFGKGRFYLLPFSGDLVVLFGPYPGEDADHPDIQAILHSMVLTGREVTLPTQMPDSPPDGMAVSCMPPESIQAQAEDTLTDLDCNTTTPEEALKWTVCNVRDSILSRNTQPLPGYMADPFTIGYWQSEGVTRSRDEAFAEITGTHLAAAPGDETFTLDRTQFPPLFGTPPEMMFGPDDQPDAIVYSEGWGADGLGAALLYFKQFGDGSYKFYAIVIAQSHFDK